MTTRTIRSVALGCACMCWLAGSLALATPAIAPRVHHILFEVSQLDASIVFYRDRFGLKLIRRMDDFAVLEAENVGVYLWQSRWSFEGARRPGERDGLGVYPHLEVSDVRRKLDQLRSVGVRVVRDAKTEAFGTEAFVADPDGYVWALVSVEPPAAKAAPATAKPSGGPR
jgi:catechol 2,3-dioxygenase-like lactoylglutathione lyase family enzyme